ncbi:hypothetical protein B0H14DRAFT_2571682 [Mycena olivaceomarginata]|nr:hypothetical protein B0H14DRAFT_2571682 [Mycena olivaceomarginata]
MASSRTRQKRRAETEYNSFTLADVLGESSAFTSQSLSADRRRTHTTTHQVDLHSPVKKKAHLNPGRPNLFADIGDGFEYVFDDLAAPPSPIRQNSGTGVKPRAKQYLSSTPLQDEYLVEFIRLEGRGDVCLTHCSTCPSSAPRETPHYRCQDCDIPDLFCKDCIVKAHGSHPLDRIKVWDGARFKNVTLKKLGLHVQLGHTYSQSCQRPIPTRKHFMVVHSNSMHKVAVDFCGCVDEEIVGSCRQQLLRRSWFPMTAKEPKTCSTFRVLEMFHTMTLQGKVTMYNFYSGLEKLTDNSGLRKMKHGGRGNDGNRLLAETKPGELAVVCPACLQPGINLPADWESASGEEKFLLTVTDQKEMSTCSGLAALDYANTKFLRGYGATGVGLGVCARHEFVQRNGAADLQKGERFANMDYILGSLLRHHYAGLLKFFSYDICCQWSKYLIERMKTMPPGIRLNLILSLLHFVIPKLHIYGHKLWCQLFFSLNYTPGAARTDGEGIERPWANIGPVATSTREMGPGSRQDMLNDHWSHWNWQKLIGLGALLKKRLLRAILERNFQRDSLTTFTENQAEHVEEWMAMVKAFEADPKKPNPYELPKSGEFAVDNRWATEHDVRLECVTEEAAEQERGVVPINNVSPSAFIIVGLDLEEQQRRIKVAVASLTLEASSKNSADVVEKRTKLARYVARFRKLQAVREFGCNKKVDKFELRFRDAQCRSALDGIRNYLHIKSCFRTYKGGQVRHQGATTHARGLMNRNDEKMRMEGEKYVAAWEAKRALVGEAKVEWHWLDPKKIYDAWTRRRIERCDGGGWKGQRAGGGSDGRTRRVRAGEHCLGSGWGWTRAAGGTSEAVLREEVRLLKEEMWRTPIALRHKARWWLEHWAPTGFEGRHAEGAAAYATRQAAIYNDPADVFDKLWAPLLGLEDVDEEILLRVSKRVAGRESDEEEEDGVLDEEEADEDDGNDGVDAEEGGEEEQNGDEEDEGSAGGDSGGEDESICGNRITFWGRPHPVRGCRGAVALIASKASTPLRIDPQRPAVVPNSRLIHK